MTERDMNKSAVQLSFLAAQYLIPLPNSPQLSLGKLVLHEELYECKGKSWSELLSTETTETSSARGWACYLLKAGPILDSLPWTLHFE